VPAVAEIDPAADAGVGPIASPPSYTVEPCPMAAGSRPAMKEQRVIQVFVGSPGDVAEERRRAFEVIQRINVDVLLPEGWRFEGVGWDQTHHPRFAWLSPQEAINQGIPQPRDCENQAHPKCYIAQYPVTQAQFQAFIEAEVGYANSRWWKGFESRKQTAKPPMWPEANVPRTDVDWFEAIAFCRWLTARGIRPKKNWEILLPTNEQRRAHARPKDHHHHIAFGRLRPLLGNRLLGRQGRQHGGVGTGLVPGHGLQHQPASEKRIVRQSLKHPERQRALILHVAG